MIRLQQPTGAVSGEKNASDSEDRIVRAAILVHAGAGGGAAKFLSGDGAISFDAARIKRVVEVHNARLARLAQEYGGEEKIPIGAYEPILDSHESGSNDRVIGRLTGKLEYQVRDVPKIGKGVPCAVANPGITFLGKETVEKVNDGRIYHLSIGIDEKTDELGETSTVVQPAAPGAMLLGDGKKNPKPNGGKMGDKLKRMKAHTERLAKLTAAGAELTKMKQQLEASKSNVKLSARRSEITHRLSAVLSQGKMTPAELKNLMKEDGLTRLAKLDDETLKTALMVFDSREKPVVRMGQLGTADPIDASDITKNLERRQLTKLRAEIKGDFRKLGKKMELTEEEKELAGGNSLEPASPGKDPHAVPGQAGDEKQMGDLGKHHMELAKHLAAGDIEKAKETHEKIMAFHRQGGSKHLAEYTGDPKSEDYKKSMDELGQRLDEQATQIGRLHGMVEELMTVEKEEGHDLEMESKDEPPAAAAS